MERTVISTIIRGLESIRVRVIKYICKCKVTGMDTRRALQTGITVGFRHVTWAGKHQRDILGSTRSHRG